MWHTTVAKEPGRFKAWPANGGLWAWGDEILAMYYDGTEDFSDPFGHTVAMHQPLWVEQARSRDGGETWTVERNPLPLPTTENAVVLPGPLDFSDPDLILCFKMAHWEFGVSFLYYSTDRGRKWHGPYHLALWGRETVNARTYYAVLGPADCLAWLSGGYREVRSEDGYEAFTIRSRDGGLTWQEQGRPCRATPPVGVDGRRFTIMPSAVRLPSGVLICFTRCLDTTVAGLFWMEAWRSDDEGVTWTYCSRIDNIGKSSPPALTALPDGRLVVTYGHRAAPFGIRARVSSDAAQTWSDEIVLRDDGGSWDLGYTRNAVLDNGSLLTVYYFNTDAGGDRRIEATCWQP